MSPASIADDGLKQIREKGYAEPYRARGLPIYAFGLSFDSATRQFAEGKVEAVISTTPWAVGIDDVAVDQGREAKNVCRVRLEPFASESVNLTYFRAPNIERDCREEDELLSGQGASRRPGVPASRE